VQSRVKRREESEGWRLKGRGRKRGGKKVVQTARAHATRGAGALTRVLSQFHLRTALSTNRSRYKNAEIAAARPIAIDRRLHLETVYSAREETALSSNRASRASFDNTGRGHLPIRIKEAHGQHALDTSPLCTLTKHDKVRLPYTCHHRDDTSCLSQSLLICAPY